ncbi:hypothetical protein HDEF_0762 [Candidatus Hamiltonella defensa 5AT (Acyrthosiphon pisum)]|uniref:Uncharacterized protein n=1 Tax=Hamiltonella defensa subsp. Acyrthosiphon pisum (strain 5AT) TaxID=572265 RepID=C4K4J7_HAMD5|nr:hypothetical protein HDEF_0762 [Candidatus Hamiltonella defensa 5AT (Acyrthosiphon pisum)]
MLTNKQKSYPFSFARKTAAFFKISRSAKPGFACSAPVAPFSALTQRLIALNETPKLSAACRQGYFFL